MEAFTYVWTDHKTKKLYIGIHKGFSNDGYICSGKFMLEEYNKRPKDFTRQIIASGTYRDMIAFETAILKSCNAKKDPLMYNQHNGDGSFYNPGHTEETKTKLKIARNKRTDKPNLGNSHSEATRKIMSNKAKNRKDTDKNSPASRGKQSHDKRKKENLEAYKAEQSRRAKLGWLKRKGLI